MARWGHFFYGQAHYDEPDVVHIKPTSMRDLHVYPTDPFDDPKISMAELLAFTSDHLQRATANPFAALTARIAPTNSALAQVTSAFTDDETKLGLRKARKVSKDAFRKTLPAAAGKIAVAVEKQFGEKSAEFVECFPHGRVIYSKCQDDKLASELQTLINGVTNHQPEMVDLYMQQSLLEPHTQTPTPPAPTPPAA